MRPALIIAASAGYFLYTFYSLNEREKRYQQSHQETLDKIKKIQEDSLKEKLERQAARIK